MRYLRQAILAAIAIVLVTIALANRGALTLRLLPETLQALFGVDWEVTLPAFVILLAIFAIGLAIGFCWEWVREHKYRSAATTERRERERIEREAVIRPQTEKDEVLAILDGR